MTAKEIIAAVDRGDTVYVGGKHYQVINGGKGGYLIKCTITGHCIGLTHADEVTLNAPEEDFIVVPKDWKPQMYERVLLNGSECKVTGLGAMVSWLKVTFDDGNEVDVLERDLIPTKQLEIPNFMLIAAGMYLVDTDYSYFEQVRELQNRVQHGIIDVNIEVVAWQQVEEMEEKDLLELITDHAKQLEEIFEKGRTYGRLPKPKEYFIFGSEPFRYWRSSDEDWFEQLVEARKKHEVELSTFEYDPQGTDIHVLLEAADGWGGYFTVTKEQYDIICEIPEE